MLRRVDRADSPTRFLVLGSAQPTALRQAGESLAGRVSVVELGGFSVADVAHFDFAHSHVAHP